MNRRSFLLALLASAGACRATHSPTQTRNRDRTLRVLTYNTHHGEGTDGRLDLARIATVIRAANPDLVALQEIDRNARRTGGVDQPAEYARFTNLHVWYGAAMPFQGGEYGQALLSRWPFRQAKVLRLPGTADREPRIAATSLVDVPQLGPIRWASVHLDASRDDSDRWGQAGTLMRELGNDGVPTLLAGDFNAVSESRVMRRILDPSSTWMDTAGKSTAPTIPSNAPRSRIDYVLASPAAKWQTSESQVLPEAVASDHRPLLVVLRKT